MLGIRDYVQVTQDKAGHSPRGSQLGKPGEDTSLIHIKPPDQQTCTQANSSSQLGLCVLGDGVGVISRTGSGLSGLPYPYPASEAARASGLYLVLHYLIHSSPQPPTSPTHRLFFLAEQLFSDLQH